MSSLETFSSAAHLMLAFGALWVLCFLLWKEYRLDSLRERLFFLRQKLFNLALEGQISFDDPAYAYLRVRLNSMIRFGHRFTVARLVIISLLRRRSCEFDDANQYEARWKEALQRLTPEQQEVLLSIHDDALVIAVRHMLSGSPVLLVILVAFATWSVVNGAANHVIRSFARMLPGLESLELEALEDDLAERNAYSHEGAPA